METNRWTIRRVGLVGYWWFDDLEVEFSEDGNLLIRGQNGAGKSITLAAIIPIILDGNTHPSRFDPFGSNEKKLRYYTLGEGEHAKKSSTSYIYAEFIKRETEETKTLIMGIHDKEYYKTSNKPPEKKFFIVSDGRQVGRDFFLSKDTEKGVDITEVKNLNRILGDSVRMISSQDEYKEMVNRALFGFKEISKFDEMISLLLMIRGVKLNKSTISKEVLDRLSDSLNTISEESVNSVAKLYYQMEEYLKSVSETEHDYGVAKKILEAYNLYIDTLLEERIHKYQKSNIDLDTIEKKIKDYDIQMKKEQKELDETQNEIKKVEKEYYEADAFLSIKENADLLELPSRVNEAETLLRQSTAEKNELQQEIESYEIQEQAFEEKIDSLDSEIKVTEFDLVDEVRSLRKANEPLSLSLLELIHLDRDATRQFQELIVKEELKEAERNVNDARDIYLANKALEDRRELIREDVAKRKKEVKELAENAERDRDRLMRDIHMYVGEIHEWHATNSVFKMKMDSAFNNVLGHAQGLTDRNAFIQLDRALSNARTNVESGYRLAIKEKISDIERIDAEIALAEGEIIKIKADSEIPPKRSLSKAEHRENLLSKEIEHLPLYQAVKFKPEIHDEEKNMIEAVLFESGLLDALIVSDSEKNTLIHVNNSVNEHYLIPRLQCEQAFQLGQFLPEYLEIEDTLLAERFRDEISNFLYSIKIGIFDDGANFISPDGRYRIGKIEGHADPDYKASFIGEESRKRKKKDRVKELQNELDEKKYDKQSINHAIELLEEKLKVLDVEYKNFPKSEPLEQIVLSIEETEHAYERSGERLAELNAEDGKISKEVNEGIVKIKHILGEKFQMIEKTSGGMERARNLIKDIAECVNRIVGLQDRYDTKYDIRRDKENGLDDCRNRLEKSKDRFRSKQEQETRVKAKLSELKALMNKEDHKERLVKIQKMESIYKAFPEKSGDLRERRGVLETAIEMTKEKLDDECANREYKKRRLSARKVVVVETMKLTGDWDGDCLELAIEKFLERRKEFLNLARDNFIYDDKVSRRISLSLEDLEKELDKHFNRFEHQYQWTQHLRPMISVNEEDENLDEIAKASHTKILVAHMRGNSMSGGTNNEATPFEFAEYLRQLSEAGRNQLDESETQLLREIVNGDISHDIITNYRESKLWAQTLEDEVSRRTLAGGLKLYLEWVPVGKEAEKRHIRDMLKFLSSEEHSMNPKYQDSLKSYIQRKLDEERELAKVEDREMDYKKALLKALDYRRWHRFKLFFEKDGEERKELTSSTQAVLSGGQKATSGYAPLFSALNLLMQNAAIDAPKYVGLDEAFAGVDYENTDVMFEYLESLDFSYILNSEKLTGLYRSVSNISIFEYIKEEDLRQILIFKSYWSGGNHFADVESVTNIIEGGVLNESIS
jgi:hypothetical protein